MAELRRDLLTGRWVILAPGRAERPHEAQVATTQAPSEAPLADCPFCPGHEDQTPPEVARRGRGDPDGPGWQVRVVPNLYPIVQGNTDATIADSDELRQRRPAGGAHEVVLLSADHHRSLAQLDDRQVLEVLHALQDRARAHAAAGHVYTQVIVNHGVRGGASLAHPHAQIVAIDVTPPAVSEEIAHIATDDHCVLCSELHRQQDDPSLVVTGHDVMAWCPWWSSSAYELLLAPRQHLPRFEEAGAELEAVAATVRDALGRLDRQLGDPPYNLVVHSLPADRNTDYHWHIHVRPRLQQDAGFELGTGIQVNIVDPAEAARHLR
jgi:UDPglucose--hexose-1-phosphate uridylyltransferase